MGRGVPTCKMSSAVFPFRIDPDSESVSGALGEKTSRRRRSPPSFWTNKKNARSAVGEEPGQEGGHHVPAYSRARAARHRRRGPHRPALDVLSLGNERTRALAYGSGISAKEGIVGSLRNGRRP